MAQGAKLERKAQLDFRPPPLPDVLNVIPGSGQSGSNPGELTESAMVDCCGEIRA